MGSPMDMMGSMGGGGGSDSGGGGGSGGTPWGAIIGAMRGRAEDIDAFKRQQVQAYMPTQQNYGNVPPTSSGKGGNIVDSAKDIMSLSGSLKNLFSSNPQAQNSNFMGPTYSPMMNQDMGTNYQPNGLPKQNYNLNLE